MTWLVFAETSTIKHLFVLHTNFEIFRNLCGCQDNLNFYTLSFRQNLHSKLTGRWITGLPQSIAQDIPSSGWSQESDPSSDSLFLDMVKFMGYSGYSKMDLPAIMDTHIFCSYLLGHSKASRILHMNVSCTVSPAYWRFNVTWQDVVPSRSTALHLQPDFPKEIRAPWNSSSLCI